MQLQLEEAGYDVITACDARQAMALVDEQTPALVISDLKMPEISGSTCSSEFVPNTLRRPSS